MNAEAERAAQHVGSRAKVALPNSIVVDVDDTFLENDHIQDDLKRHIEREFGPECPRQRSIRSTEVTR